MFVQGGAMQLSAANLLIASQQLARAAQKSPSDVEAQFAAALAKEKSAPGATSFEPIEFRQGAPYPSAASAAVPARPEGYAPARLLGAHLDIHI